MVTECSSNGNHGSGYTARITVIMVYYSTLVVTRVTMDTECSNHGYQGYASTRCNHANPIRR